MVKMSMILDHTIDTIYDIVYDGYSLGLLDAYLRGHTMDTKLICSLNTIGINSMLLLAFA